MRYGSIEFTYANPIASTLVSSVSFRNWFVAKTCFAEHAPAARLLWQEQWAKRTPGSLDWWRSYWTTRCFCGGCGQRETDLLAVFETPRQFRFAVHVEVKSPADRLGKDQVESYARRAECWAGRGRAPKTVVLHDAATSFLVCAPSFLIRFPDARRFPAIATYAEIEAQVETPYPSPPD